MLGAVTLVFFLLYKLFRDREEGDWSDVINYNLSNLFFGMGMIMINIMLYVAWLFSLSQNYTFANILKWTSLGVFLITLIVIVFMFSKVVFAFIQLSFTWFMKKVGFR